MRAHTMIQDTPMTTTIRMPIRALAALALATSLTVPATVTLAQTDAGATDTAASETATPGTATIGDIRIEAAWTRQTPPGARAGGGYATITNTGTEPDVLIGGSAPFTNRFEVHEMSVTDGVMRMAELADGLAIPPGETVELRPGGFHLMFIDMTEPPVEGTTVPVTLEFARAGTVTLDLPVAAIGATAPDGAAGEGMDHGSTDHGSMDHGTMKTDAKATN